LKVKVKVMGQCGVYTGQARTGWDGTEDKDRTDNVRGKKRTGGDWIGGERRRKEKRGEEARRQDTKGLGERRGSLISGWGYFRCCRCRFVSIIKKLENGREE
jgi:hypothetical protein